MSKNLAISFILFFLVQYASAQPVAAVNIELHSDQRVYVAGEMVWLDGKLEGAANSKFIDVHLIDRTGLEKGSVTLLNQDGRFYGYIEVPKEIRSDFYFLDCSIKGISTKSLVLPIIVIHPSYPPGTCELKGPQPPSIKNSGSSSISIVGNQSYPIRGEVKFDVSGLSDLKNISVNVVRDDMLSAYADSVISPYTIFTSHAAKGDVESEGHQVIARVLDIERGLPMKGIPVYASIMGDQANVSYGLSDAQGEIKFLFAPVLNETRIVFSVPLKDSKKVKVEMLDNNVIHEPISFPCLVLKEAMRNSIEERLLNVNVMRQYGLSNIGKHVGIRFDTTDFYGKPDARYILDNYVRFPDMKEILFEFVPEVRLRKLSNDSNMLVEVLNDPYKRYFTESAMVMLDGIPVQNVNELLDFDPLKLKSIDVMSRMYYLGDIHFNGILNYKSYTNDLAGFTLTPAEVIYPFKGAQGLPEPIFFKHKALQKSGLPDFRNLLFRAVDFKKSSNIVSPISFSASDTKGDFKIIIQGTNKTGSWTSGAATFSVQ